MIVLDSGSSHGALSLLQYARLPDLMAEIGDVVIRQTHDRIDILHRSPEGARWSPWSPAYAKSRMGEGSLLNRSGRLYDSIKARVKVNTVEISTNVKYAKTHQYGSKKRNIPQRKFLGISKADGAEINKVAAKWLKGLVK